MPLALRIVFFLALKSNYFNRLKSVALKLQTVSKLYLKRYNSSEVSRRKWNTTVTNPKMIWTILNIICIIASVQAAPTEISPFYKVVTSDSRLAKLREYKFVAECRKTSKFSTSICFALYDVSLSFNDKKLDFTKENATFKEDYFCETLTQVFPDSPANNDSIMNFKEVSWFKDVLSQDNGEECTSQCIYEDKITYESMVTPLCRFLLNQYSYLKNNSSTTQEIPKRKLGEFRKTNWTQ